ncbi:PRTRC system ThiF family protein [Chryseobacterium pennae]|uniref:PRTRC system ThiF family protein n=1 Tax=Chryseobacterium pennae TaxID=2258962 RepID=A0A3D9C8H5_9FLAO|nr:PRTRC system ThiF family protein [Chryseobacterium pennae]REC61801.1 PRTRC system ThiF family protein [Chryseobacterium pennae]
MKTVKQNVHFLDEELMNPVNPIRVNVIGAGGTGSKFMTCLMEINHSLIELGHPGLQVHLWDDDIISSANIGRQRFAESERGLNKSVAIINRLNRWSGTNWKAETQKFQRDIDGNIPENAGASIYVSCTDTVASRFEIAEIIKQLNKQYSYRRDRAKYWLDLGNTKYSGQAILSTVGTIKQPDSKKFKTFGTLPSIIDEYGTLMTEAEPEDDTPSCSMAESLQKQDLFINASLAQMGASLLWNLFLFGMTENRGFFHNLKNFQTQPISVGN